MRSPDISRIGFDEFAAHLAAEGASRFPRWDGEMWRAFVAGPASALERGLKDSGRPSSDAGPALESYLTLAREAVGLGYLYPDSAGRRNFFRAAWIGKMPRELPLLLPGRAAEIIAACWNIGENLEKAEAWVGAAVLPAFESAPIDRVEETVGAAADMLFRQPPEELGGGPFEIALVPAAGADHAFMPGRIRFLAPLVVEVSDRSAGVDGRPRSAQVILLDAPPKLLGQARPRKTAAETLISDPIWARAATQDPRVTGVFHCARNRWRAAASMNSSQMIAVAAPAA